MLEDYGTGGLLDVAGMRAVRGAAFYGVRRQSRPVARCERAAFLDRTDCCCDTSFVPCVLLWLRCVH